MAHYDVAPAWFHSPRGRTALVYVRVGTSDYNTAQASVSEDEYHLAELDLRGHAIDIGGYLGTVALAMLLDNPELRVTVVEPLADNIDMIRRNLTVNGVIDRAEILQAAAGYPAGGTQIIHHNFVGDEFRQHHRFVGNISLLAGHGDFGCNDIGVHDHTEVPIVTLGELVGPETSFLKSDCEGGEWAAFLDPATARIPRIYGEVHPTDNHHPRELVPLLADHDVTFTGPEAGPCEFQAVLR